MIQEKYTSIGVSENVKEKLDLALLKKQAKVGKRLSYNQFITLLIRADE